jgi:hypothetical protein
VNEVIEGKDEWNEVIEYRVSQIVVQYMFTRVIDNHTET